MIPPYEEIVHGEALLRHGPGERHEEICACLHHHVRASLGEESVATLLLARSIVQLTPGSLIRPDLALCTAATGKVWLIAEVIDSLDHQPDTVLKKALYEDVRLPRLWIVDPRFDNVEVYHATRYGLALKEILCQNESITETLLPGFFLPIQELFGFVRS